MNISQSLLKSLLKYRNGDECGLVFKAKYIDGRYDLFPPSDAQNMGAWFEYMATGSVPKGGVIPKPKYKKAAKNGKRDYYGKYQVIYKHIQNFKKTMEHYGFEILRAGEDIRTLYPNSMDKFGFEVWLTGTLDIRVRATKDIWSKFDSQPVLVAKKGQTILVDIKTTGLMDDKYNDFGWDINNLENKINLVTQPVHYKYIELLNTGEDMPFIFLLYSTNSPTDARIIDFKVDESAYTQHQLFIEQGVENMLHINKYGVKPTPSLDKCSKCALKNDCKYKVEVAPISVFYFGG